MAESFEDASGNFTISESCADVAFEYNLFNFKFRNAKDDSPVFSLFQAEWFIRVCPFNINDPCIFRLFLRRKSFINTAPFDHLLRIAFTVGKQDGDGFKYNYIFKEFLFRKGFKSSPRIFLDNEEIQKNISQIFSNGNVKISCSFSLLNYFGYEGYLPLSENHYSRGGILGTSPLDDSIDTSDEDCCYIDTSEEEYYMRPFGMSAEEYYMRKEIEPASYFPSTSSEEKIIPSEEKIIPCTLKSPDCPSTSSEKQCVPKMSIPHDCPSTSSEKECVPKMSIPHGIQTLSQSFKELLDTGRNADVTIKVKEQTFQAHQLILESRFSVLASMFQHDMKEKSSRMINIDDCHPDCFKDFLLYLYTGKADHIMASSSSSIYHIADKYNVKELMDACRDCMISNMSVDSFCDIVLIAAMHNEDELMKTAIEYFIGHAEDILQSQGWQAFLPEHATVANELLQKLFLRDKEFRDKMRTDKTCGSQQTT